MIYELEGRFVGLKNYIKILSSKDFWLAFARSFIWTGGTLVGQLLIGTAAALLLNKEFKGRTLVRAFVILPFFIPTVSATLMWKWLLNANYGIISFWVNTILGREAEPIMWLTSKSFAFFTVIMIGIWRFFPFVTINVLARLQIIPEELYEAARIDGANTWQLFRYITAPAIKEVFIVVALLRGIFMLKKFDIIYMLTAGGPGTSTETLPLYIYNYAFSGMRLGHGSAAAILLFLTSLAFIILYMRSTKASLGD
jgi:multiple sugar transport system permease protein